MRTQRRNKQTMWYSLPNGKKPKYETDDNGNIIYDDIDGEKIPRETGEYEPSYSKPVKFKGAIFSQLENAIIRAWGNDNSNNYATLVVAKNALPDLVNGAKIWRKNKIKYKDDEVTPDESSAEYTVAGILDEELNEDSYYLQKES